MSAREEAAKRLTGLGSGQAWDQVDAIKGVGWALLHLADTLAEVLKPDPVEVTVQGAGLTPKERLLAERGITEPKNPGPKR